MPDVGVKDCSDRPSEWCKRNESSRVCSEKTEGLGVAIGLALNSLQFVQLELFNPKGLHVNYWQVSSSTPQFFLLKGGRFEVAPY